MQFRLKQCVFSVNISLPVNTMFFDYDIPDSCCAERPLHIPTFGIYSSHGSRADRPTDKLTDYNNPSLLIIDLVCREIVGSVFIIIRSHVITSPCMAICYPI